MSRDGFTAETASDIVVRNRIIPMPVYASWKVLTVDRWSRRSGNVSISFQDCLIASPQHRNINLGDDQLCRYECTADSVWLTPALLTGRDGKSAPPGVVSSAGEGAGRCEGDCKWRTNTPVRCLCRTSNTARRRRPARRCFSRRPHRVPSRFRRLGLLRGWCDGRVPATGGFH
jgi:hypothetical protein